MSPINFKLPVQSIFFFLLLALSLSQPLQSFAQQLTAKGTVRDEEGMPLQGVSVVRKGSPTGVVTDSSGFFSLRVANANAQLVFSYIGHTTKTLKVEERGQMQVTLEKSAQTQEDVVVIGYGSSRRADLTGAVTTFKPTLTEAQQVTTVDNLMKGRAAGVQVQQSAGDPGGAVSVKIRGINSLRGDNEPLYVVDGIIINNVTSDAGDPFKTKNANSGQTRQTGLAGINPLDIKSMEILKDASATAIYGSRGANGVVIITTRQGRGKPVIRFTTLLEVSRMSKKLPVLDAPGYANYINEYETSFGRPARYSLDSIVDISWQDEMQRTGVSSNNRLSITGSSPDSRTKYFLAAGFLNTQGIVQNSGFKQGDLKMNLTQTLTPRLRMNFTLSGVFANSSMSQGTEPVGGGTNSMIMKMLVARPIANAQTDLSDPTIPYDNPFSWLLDYDDLSEEKRILSGLGLTYKISNAFSYKLNLAADFRNKERKRWYGKKTFSGRNANGQLGLSQYEKKFYQIENLLTYTKRVATNHQIDGTLGVTYDNENTSNSSVVNEDFFNESLRTDGFGFGTKLYPFYRDRFTAEVFSVLARINYNYKSKYLFTVSGRTDGSSKFAQGNKFSYFPAVAFAWKVAEEDFLKDVKSISNLKLRVGYGRSGNQAIGPYNSFARYSSNLYVAGNDLVTGAIPTNIQNNELKWETTNQFNAGVDVGLWNNRFTATLEVYHKKTTDLLQTFFIAPSSGYRVLVTNIGDLENKGLELSMTALLVSKPNFTWNAGANISFNRNKILNLGLPAQDLGSYKNVQYYIGPNVSTGIFFKDPANIYMVGQPIGMFYGYKTDGIWQTGEDKVNKKQFGNPILDGDVKYVDLDGDGDIGPNDRTIIGNPNPDFTYGFNTGFTYKNFTLDMFLYGSYGSQVANGNLMNIGNANGTTGNNLLADYYYKAWTPTNPSNRYPRIGFNNNRFTDQFLEDASFLRLANVSLGYSFTLKNSNFIKSVGANITAKNLFTLTEYSGFDPEVNSFSFEAGRIGVDWGAYPNLRSVALGLNVTF